MSWVYDALTSEIVTKDELARRMSKRPGRKKIDLSFIPDRPVRGRWIWDRGLQKVVTAEDYYARNPNTAEKTHMVIGPLQDYKSMHDGTMITDRSQHREHLKRHGLVEFGNDKEAASWKKKPLPPVETPGAY